MVVQAQAVPVLARVARARAVQAQAAQEQAVQAQAIAVQAQAVAVQAAPGDWLQEIASYDLNQPFHLCICTVAGDYYPGLIPAAMADKTVLSMKAAPGTGEVRVMHAVPHTLVAVGCFSGEQALNVASLRSKECMDHANQTPGKPDSRVNMLQELNSRQEIQVPTGSRGKVFQNFLFFSTMFLFVLNQYQKLIHVSHYELIMVLTLV